MLQLHHETCPSLRQWPSAGVSSSSCKPCCTIGAPIAALAQLYAIICSTGPIICSTAPIICSSGPIICSTAPIVCNYMQHWSNYMQHWPTYMQSYAIICSTGPIICSTGPIFLNVQILSQYSRPSAGCKLLQALLNHSTFSVLEGTDSVTVE